MTLRFRITLLVALAVAVAVTAVSSAAFYFAHRELRGEVDEFLLQRASIVELVPIRQLGGGFFSLPIRPFRPGFEFPAGDLLATDSVVQIIAPGGQIILAFEGAPLLPIEEQDLRVAVTGEGPELRDVEVAGEPFRMVTVGIVRIGALQIGRSLAETEQILTDLRVSLLAIGGIGVAVGALIAWIVAGRALVPVWRLTAAAEHVAETQDLTAPIDIDRQDELGRLARSFNTMLAALAASRRQQQRLVVDASHELRTPITSLRTNLEVLARNEQMEEAEREELLSDVRTELDELTALVSELVQLSTDVEVAEEPVSDLQLDELVSGTVELARRRTGRTIILGGTETIVEGRPIMLERAVSNLLDNAHKWSPDGEPIEVSVQGGTVTVRDHGAGIPAEDLPLVFDRFYRSEQARSKPGSGLGLSIVKQIVEAHGGRAWVEAADGGGTIAGFELPTD